MTPTSGGSPSPLNGIDLVIFDKDGTLIAFDTMWGGWGGQLGKDLDTATGASIATSLFAMLGYDPVSGRILPHGGLAATPMARLRERTRQLLIEAGIDATAADHALDEAWRAPDPIRLARPLANLDELFRRLRRSGRAIAVATTDDRDPTERTLAALGITGLVDAFVCADDGVAVKPAPDMVLHLCARLGFEPGRAAVVGDSLADLEMGRAAGAGLVVGVLTGVADASDLATAADLILASVADLPTA